MQLTAEQIAKFEKMIEEDEKAEEEKRLKEQEENGPFPRNKKGYFLIPFSVLKDFPNHKFKLYKGERLDDMVQSIKENGIIEPLVVWKKDDEYIILSGHNRKKAAEIAGLTKAPAVIYTDIDDNQAQIIVGETNLRQRSFTDMTHSERAFCLAEHYEALKKKRGRKSTDELQEINSNKFTNESNKNSANPHNNAENSNLAQNVPNSFSRDKIGQKYSLDRMTVTRYIRIATLTPKLLSLLDEGRIKLNAAYELTFIDDEECQLNVCDVIEDGTSISGTAAKKLRAFYQRHGSLTTEEIKSTLQKPDKSKKKGIYSKFKQFFPIGTSDDEIEKTIYALLEERFDKKQ